jgi:hypothetical protein
MSEHPSGLDDPEYAAFAWRRYRRMLGWMTLASLATAIVVIIGLEHFYGPLSFVAILAAIGGIGGSVLMGAALMGLVFLSSGTGHDEAVENPLTDDPDLDTRR